MTTPKKMPKVIIQKNSLWLMNINDNENPKYQEDDIILERKTNDPEILKKLLNIEKSLIKRAKNLGVI